MDFIVSKVAMSICALLVVCVLGGVLEENALFTSASELDLALNDLSATIDILGWSDSEGQVIWKVPSMPDGQGIEMCIDGHSLHAKAGQKSAMAFPACAPHTWTWNGSALNRSSLELLTINEPLVKVRSGAALEIDARSISFENQEKIFVFVSTAN